jgi:ABC-type dipeptide/oligopeptide/nickel transport system permease subunit
VLAAILLGGLLAAPLTGWIGLKGPTVHDLGSLNLVNNPTGPSSAHPLGVDTEGRDVLSRLLFGLRSLVLISLAGAALGLLAGQALAELARRSRSARLPIQLLWRALHAYPPLLLGLALGLTLGPGAWRLIVAIAVAGLAAGSRRELPALAVRALAGAMALDFGLTFLGDGPGGLLPQLGQMVARAGVGIVTGTPAWWTLVFPGLAVFLALLAARVLVPADGLGHELIPPVRWAPRTPLGYLSEQLVGAVVTLGVVCLFALAALTAFAGSDGRAHSALGTVGADLSGTVSLLAGGGLVWILATAAHVWLGTRPRRLARLARRSDPARRSQPPRRLARIRRVRAVGQLATLPELALAAAPVGWLAFLALYLFSDSVGKLPILPSAATYVGLTHSPGHWAHALVMPWLVLGLTGAAVTAPGLSAAIVAIAGSGQQRVARAAGVPTRRLARQLRRGLLGPLLDLSVGRLGEFIGAAVVIEASFSIPGVGAVTVSDFNHGLAATVTDVAVGAAVLVVLLELATSLVRVILDPRVID